MPPGTSPDRPSDSDGLLGTDGLKRDLAARTLRGATATVASQVLRFLISIAGTVILARLLTPVDYGLVGMVSAVTAFLAIFRDLGLDSAVIQSEDVTADQVSALFWINTGTGLALAVVTAGIAPAVAWFYGEPSLTWITVVSAIGFLVGGSVVQHEALLRRQMRFARLATVEVGALLVGYVAGILMAWHHAGYWALVLSQLVAASARALALWISLDWRPCLSPRFSGLRPLLTFGGHLTGFAFVNYFSRNLDNLLIGRYWGPYQLGLYSRAYQLLLLPIDQINSPITAVAVPALSRLADSPERYRRAYLRILEKIAMLTMPLMAFLIMTSDWVVELALGPSWSGVSQIFSLLGIVGIVQPVAGTAGWLFITQGRVDDMFRWGVLGGTLAILSICAGLPWGATGVAASYSFVSLVIIIPLLVWFVGRKGPVRTSDFYITIAPSMTAALSICVGLGAVRRALDISGGLGLLISFGLTACLTLVVLSGFRSGRLALRDIGQSLHLVMKRATSRGGEG